MHTGRSERSKVDVMYCPDCADDLEDLGTKYVQLREWWCPTCVRSWKEWQLAARSETCNSAADEAS